MLRPGRGDVTRLQRKPWRLKRRLVSSRDCLVLECARLSGRTGTPCNSSVDCIVKNTNNRSSWVEASLSDSLVNRCLFLINIIDHQHFKEFWVFITVFVVVLSRARVKSECKKWIVAIQTNMSCSKWNSLSQQTCTTVSCLFTSEQTEIYAKIASQKQSHRLQHRTVGARDLSMNLRNHPQIKIKGTTAN